jgi:diguanylate cyclase (GGDEF)-like protein
MPYSELYSRSISDVSTRPVRRLLIPVAAVVFGFCAICLYLLIGARETAWRTAGDSAEKLIVALESDIARNIETLDLSLQGVVDALKIPDFDKLEPRLRQRVLFDRSTTARDLGAMMVLDADGVIRIDSRSPSANPVNIGDRDYFKNHMKDRTIGLQIAEPMLSRIANEWFLGLSRRIDNSDGSFGGVAIASLRLSYFERLFTQLHLDPRSNVTLSNAAGTVIMRWPGGYAYVGRNIRQGELYKQVERGPAGRFESYSVTDGEHRLTVYKKIGQLPLIIGIGQSTAQIYASWKAYAISIGAIMILLCATALWLAIYLCRELLRRREVELSLTSLALTDGLTGLSNYRHFTDMLGREWQRAMRDKKQIALIMIDTDFFKIYNDTYGHPCGDALLRTIGNAIASTIRRGSDFGARYGGDEFAVLLPDTSDEGARLISEKIRGRLGLLCEERQIAVNGLSIGISTVRPSAGERYVELVSAADQALYSAKRNGRNRTEVMHLDATASSERVERAA